MTETDWGARGAQLMHSETPQSDAEGSPPPTWLVTLANINQPEAEWYEVVSADTAYGAYYAVMPKMPSSTYMTQHPYRLEP